MEIPATYKKVTVVKKSTNWDEATKIVEVETPKSIGENEVMVKVFYSGIEASDILQNAGHYGPLRDAEPAETKTGEVQIGDCGCEGVGTVIMIGSKVNNVKVGQSVFFSGFGISFREITILPGHMCFPCPENDPKWCAIPISAFTAVGGLETVGRLKKGENVLVTAASGGTGQFAVQWAKKRGCRVAGTCGSEEKAKVLKDIGCDVVINYKVDDVDAVLKKEFPKGLDVIYESVGGDLRSICFNNLAVFGRLVIIGSVGEDYTGSSSLGPMPYTTSQLMFKSLSVGGFFLFHFVADPSFPQLAKELVTGVVDGSIKVTVDPGCSTFKGIEAVQLAQKQMRTGQNVGKIYFQLA